MACQLKLFKSEPKSKKIRTINIFTEYGPLKNIKNILRGDGFESIRIRGFKGQKPKNIPKPNAVASVYDDIDIAWIYSMPNFKKLPHNIKKRALSRNLKYIFVIHGDLITVYKGKDMRKNRTYRLVKE